MFTNKKVAVSNEKLSNIFVEKREISERCQGAVFNNSFYLKIDLNTLRTFSL